MNIGVGSKRCNTYIFHNNNRVAFLEIMQYRFSKSIQGIIPFVLFLLA